MSESLASLGQLALLADLAAAENPCDGRPNP
jgi:hypothetical protein